MRESRATLAEDAYLPDMFRDMLLRDPSIMSTFQLVQSGFPLVRSPGLSSIETIRFMRSAGKASALT